MWERGVFACRFRAARLVVKTPYVRWTKRHRASSLELTRDVLALSVRALRLRHGLVLCAAVNVRFSWSYCELAPHQRFSLRSTHDRRLARGVLLRPNHGLDPLQAVFSSVTPISDRIGVRAPKASRAKAVTYRAEGHFGD